jgi:hypothetical protein
MPTRLQTEVADTIQAFLDGTGGKWDWDEFVSLRIRNDRGMDAIRELCAAIPDIYPPDNPGHYCGEQGIQFMRDIVQRIRALPD